MDQISNGKYMITVQNGGPLPLVLTANDPNSDSGDQVGVAPWGNTPLQKWMCTVKFDGIPGEKHVTLELDDRRSLGLPKLPVVINTRLVAGPQYTWIVRADGPNLNIIPLNFLMFFATVDDESSDRPTPVVLKPRLDNFQSWNFIKLEE